MDVLVTLIVGAVLFWLLCLRRYGNGPRKYAEKKDGEFNSDYKMTKVIKVPITRGMLTTFLSKLISSFVGRLFLLDQMLDQGEFTMFRTIDMKINPTFYPNIELQEPCAKPNDINLTNDEIEEVLNGSEEKDGFTFNSVNDFVSKYRSGETTPSAVAENAIAAIENSKKLNAIVKYKLDSIRSQASASTERYKTSSTLSPLDGVFVVIKDEFAVKGMRYQNGTSYRNPGLLAKEDSVAVDKLRRLGCIVLAVANMHEFGFGTSGNNPNEGFGACRTPYDPNHYSGGSSSGCASAVAAGIATMGIGTDGGG
uniref:Amidase domain-containing protein n=1 Tax=Ciona savignyi TaxID=51511 RepID=H2Z588_CIOSA